MSASTWVSITGFLSAGIGYVLVARDIARELKDR
jgi:hypothetical protein